MGLIVFLILGFLLFCLVRSPNQNEPKQNVPQHEAITKQPTIPYDKVNPLDVLRAFSCLAANVSDSYVRVVLTLDLEKNTTELSCVQALIGPFCGNDSDPTYEVYRRFVPNDIAQFLASLPLEISSGGALTQNFPTQYYSLNFEREVCKAMAEGSGIGSAASTNNAKIERETIVENYDGVTMICVTLNVNYRPPSYL